MRRKYVRTYSALFSSYSYDPHGRNTKSDAAIDAVTGKERVSVVRTEGERERRERRERRESGEGERTLL